MVLDMRYRFETNTSISWQYVRPLAFTSSTAYRDGYQSTNSQTSGTMGVSCILQLQYKQQVGIELGKPFRACKAWQRIGPWAAKSTILIYDMTSTGFLFFKQFGH